MNNYSEEHPTQRVKLCGRCLSNNPLRIRGFTLVSYCITVLHRNSQQWHLTNTNTHEKIISEDSRVKNISPLSHKWFSGDTVRFHESDDGDISSSLVFSPTREATYIPGVLVLESQRTFGRTSNKKRLLYKCVPHNPRLPSFLVPYEITLGFSKSISNKYVLFRFDSWTGVRPHGILVEVLGDVSNKTVFYDYQLYCRELRHSIAPFIRIVKENTASIPVIPSHVGCMGEHVHNTSHVGCMGEHVNNVSNHTSQEGGMGGRSPPFSIDPEGSTDLDDAFSIAPHPTHPGHSIVSIYIANVFQMIETLGVWKSFSNRVSTIYLPDRKVTLLPPILSDNLCSLLENEWRFAFVMDVEITSTGEILKDTAAFRTAQIKVSRNYRYESRELLSNIHYLELLRISKLADSSIQDSHDVVAFWMIQMNTICGSVLVQHNTGILRGGGRGPEDPPTSSPIENSSPDIDKSTQQFIQNWKHMNCQYMAYDSSSSGSFSSYHSGLKTHTYAHITSPVRRLVDIVNQTLLIHRLGLAASVSDDALAFCENWIAQIGDINRDMKSIRKLQTDCELLHLCETDPELLATLHSGVVFDKKSRETITYEGKPSDAQRVIPRTPTLRSGVLTHDDSTVFYSYTVYLTGLRRVARVRSIVDYPEYSCLSFRLFFFTDEDNIQNKVRLQIVTNSQ